MGLFTFERKIDRIVDGGHREVASDEFPGDRFDGLAFALVPSVAFGLVRIAGGSLYLAEPCAGFVLNLINRCDVLAMQ